MYYCCGISDVGNTRAHNEDAFLINKIVMTKARMESSLSIPFIIGVADGVAGEKSGEIASRLSLQLLSNIKFCSATNLKKKILDIHENVRSYGLNHDESLNMQSTLCALAVDENNEAYSVNIGDSRMYRFRDGEIIQLTKDQSLVQLLVDAGEISREESREHQKRNVIFPVIGNFTIFHILENSLVEITNIIVIRLITLPENFITYDFFPRIMVYRLIKNHFDRIYYIFIKPTNIKRF